MSKNKEFEKFVDDSIIVGLNNKQTLQDLDFIEALLGLSSETGELVQLFKKEILYNKEVSKEDVKDEAGDVLHYLIRILNYYHLTLDEVMDYNMKKIKERQK